MKFGAVPLEEAEGLILAHSIKLGRRAFKKGHALTAADLELLKEAAVTMVTGARLEPGDMGEDDAARAVASALVGPHITLGKAFTGRTNLFAEQRGILLIDHARLDALNLIDEAITVGTLKPFEFVQPQQMIATVKVIPFAVPEAIIQRALMVARAGPPMIRLAALQGRAVGLIQTRLPGTKESVLNSTTEIIRGRLSALDCELCAEIRCAHQADEIAASIATLIEAGAKLVLAVGASAIVDRKDVIPAGITEAGGTVDHFGMPVDPGNLLLLAHRGTVPVLGLPGCARSPKLNGFDWVLQRLIADIPVRREDIMTMGAGGLLMEIPSRPLPRAVASPKPTRPATLRPSDPPKVAAVVLAAGQSRRMGGPNKLLALVDGKPLIGHVVDAVLQSRARPIVVVTGHQDEAVRAALARRAVSFVHNPDFAEGMSTSVRRGLDALPPDINGALVCLGDMPRSDARLLDRLIEAFNPLEGRAIGVPVYRGKRGNPVLWAAQYFAEMKQLSGDVGARHMIGEHGEAVYEIESADRSVVIDIDTPAALEALVAEG